MSLSFVRASFVALVCAVIPMHAASCAYFDKFNDNKDGTVTDPRTSLVWQRCAIGQTWSGSNCAGDGLTMNWAKAMQHASGNKFLKRSDWRLPTVDELKAVVGNNDDCLVGSAQNKTKPWRAASKVFSAVQSDGHLGIFWSSTEFTKSGAWYVYFFDGGVHSVGKTAPTGNARLVR